MGGTYETSWEVGFYSPALAGERGETHFGVLLPLLVGGLGWFVLFFGTITVTLVRSFTLLNELKEVGLGWILLVYFLAVVTYLPFPFHSDIYTAMIGGLALGRLRRDLGGCSRRNVLDRHRLRVYPGAQYRVADTLY